MKNKMIRAGCILSVLILFACEQDRPLSGDTKRPPIAVQDGSAVRDRSATAYRRRQSMDAGLVRAELLKRGDPITDEELDAAWEVFAENFGQERLDRMIASGVTIADLKNRVRARLEFETLVKEEVQKPISELEIRAFYESNRSRYVTEEGFVAREIFLSATDEESYEEQRAGMQRIIEELGAGTGFEILARRYSQAESAIRGGSTPRLTRNDVESEVWRVLSSLGVGEYQVIETSEGVHLIQLVSHVPGRTVALEDAREEIVSNLEAKRHSEAVSREISSLRRAAGIPRLDTMGDGGSRDEYKQGGTSSQRPH